MPISGRRTVGPATLPATMGGGPNRSKVAIGTMQMAKPTLRLSPDHQPASGRARIGMRESYPSRYFSAREKEATVLAPLKCGKGTVCIFPSMHDAKGVLVAP